MRMHACTTCVCPHTACVHSARVPAWFARTRPPQRCCRPRRVRGPPAAGGAFLPARPALAGAGGHLRQRPALLVRLPLRPLGAAPARAAAVAQRPREPRGAAAGRRALPEPAALPQRPRRGHPARGQGHPHGGRLRHRAAAAGQPHHAGVHGGQPLSGGGEHLVAARRRPRHRGRHWHPLHPHGRPELPALLLPGGDAAPRRRLHLHRHPRAGEHLHRRLLGAPKPRPLRDAGDGAVRRCHGAGRPPGAARHRPAARRPPARRRRRLSAEPAAGRPPQRPGTLGAAVEAPAASGPSPLLKTLSVAPCPRPSVRGGGGKEEPGGGRAC